MVIIMSEFLGSNLIFFEPGTLVLIKLSKLF